MPKSEPPSDRDSERRLTHLGAAVGSLAHDLQNLMLVLRLDAGRIARQLGADHPARPDTLNESLDQLEALVSRLGELSESAPEVALAAPLLHRALREARGCGAAVRTEVSEPLPALRCDPLLLRLGLVHLLGRGDSSLRAIVDDDRKLVVEVRSDVAAGMAAPGHSEFGSDPGATLVARAVRLARGRLERIDGGVRIVLPPAS